MSLLTAQTETTTETEPPLALDESDVTVHLLNNAHEAEVLSFLAARPVHTVFMAGFIRDNGLESQLNRGSFYGCRNRAGQLEGVALIGHATLVEARTGAALAAFARQAQKNPLAHVIMGEREKIEAFWRHYNPAGQTPRSICRDLLLEQRWLAQEACESASGLRPATLDDLPLVVSINAAMIREQSGVNPLETDPIGFRLRLSRRIEQGRIWVWVENEQIVFKADVTSETPDVIYLEGVYVNPEERGKGYGLRCFSHLCKRLLARTVSICLLVNEQNESAQSFYYKAGYELRSYYDTIYLKPKSD